jgi:hypothetical protein
MVNAHSAQTGALAIAIQTAQGVPATAAMTGLRATQIALAPQQEVAQTPPEIGGTLFLSNSYKRSVSAAGNVSFNVRPQSFGYFLKAFAGVYATAVGPQAGIVSHTFTAAGLGVDLPWVSIVKANYQDSVNGNFAEVYTDCRVESLGLTIPSRGLVTCQAQIVGMTTQGDDSYVFPAVDSSPCFVTSANPSLITGAGAPLATMVTLGGSTFSLLSASFQMQNQYSTDEYAIGSPFLQGITLLQRQLHVSLDVYVKDPTLYRKIYQNGGAQNWSPVIYRDALSVQSVSASEIPTFTNPYSLTVQTPVTDFTLMPISLAGAQLVRATITGVVTINAPATDVPFQVVLNNTVAGY